MMRHASCILSFQRYRNMKAKPYSAASFPAIRFRAALLHKEIHQAPHERVVGAADERRGLALLRDQPTIRSVFR